MDLSLVLETGQNSPVAPKKGRFRDALSRFTRKPKQTATVSIQTSTERSSEPVVNIIDVSPPESRIRQRLMSCVQFIMFMFAMIGGIYAILRICNVDFLNNDSFEITIRRN